MENIFGKPREGIHSFRLFDLAVVDIVATIFAARTTNHFLPKLSLQKHLLYWFAAGVVAHLVFGVQTKVTTLLR